MSDRYFPNTFADYQGETYLDGSNQLNSNLNSTILQWIARQMNRLEQNLHHVDSSDGSVYTGYAGISLLYFRLGQLFPDQRTQNLNKAKQLIDRILRHADHRVATFLCGETGPLAIAAVLSHHLGDENNNTKKNIEKIISMRRVALSRSSPDEFLYGRSGYLSTLFFLRRELGDQCIDDSLITEIFESMIRSGEDYAKKVQSRSKLLYSWCDTEYFGAAHGLSGIIYLLLKICRHPSFVHLQHYAESHLLPTVDYLTKKQLSSGNYMSSNDSKSDHLVQWCHGAPGFVYMFLQAYQLTQNSSYLERATAAGDVVWQRGLLRKGYGLCHGAAGNAYVFLELYKVTKDIKWLHRAIKFAEFCLDYGKHSLSRTPDCPFSLFEGLAGTIYFLVDLLHPLSARFPCFDD